MPIPDAGGVDLPPTLQPEAIFRAAPPRNHRLSVLVAIHVYAVMFLAVWSWVHHGRTVAKRFQAAPRQTITLLFEDQDLGVPPRRSSVIRGGHSSSEPSVIAHSHEPNLPVLDPVLPVASVTRDLPEVSLPPPPVAGPDGSVAHGEGGQGAGAGRGDGRGSSKGSGRAMFRAAPGMNPGLNLNDLEVVHEEIPGYPLLAEWGGIQGDVVVRVTINEKGIPIRTELLEGPPALQSETMRAVKLWRFGRGIFRGRKVDAIFDMTFRFVLR